MPVKRAVRIRAECKHRTERGLLGAGEVFEASDAELASFGDKFELIGDAEVPGEPEQGTGEADGVTPQARELAEAQGVDLDDVAGSGAGGRILKSDVEAYLADLAEASNGDAAR